MTKPYLFLDVDGVLNRLGPDGGDWNDFEKHKLSPFNQGPFPLWLSKSMCAALANLPVEIVWLTTWAEEAPRLIAPAVGFSEFDVAGFGTDLSGKRVSKIGCLEIWLEENGVRPFIWIDDEAIPYYAEQDFQQMGWKCLLIKPNPYQGILVNHIAQIQNFVEGLNNDGKSITGD